MANESSFLKMFVMKLIFDYNVETFIYKYVVDLQCTCTGIELVPAHPGLPTMSTDTTCIWSYKVLWAFYPYLYKY